jgi:hypothetical protein
LIRDGEEVYGGRVEGVRGRWGLEGGCFGHDVEK